MRPKQNFFNYSRFWYLRISTVLVLVNIALYAKFRPSGITPYGGTAMGYLLGIESILIVIYLAWFGMQKRLPAKRLKYRPFQELIDRSVVVNKTKDLVLADYSKELGPERSMQGRLSVHVYLGLALLFLVTMHTGFKFGPNVHTLAFALLLVVVVSGVYGTLLYLNYPGKITQNMGDGTLPETLKQISELDESARLVALELPDEVNELITRARQHTNIGATPSQRLLGSYPECPTREAVSQLRILAEKYRHGNQPQNLRELYSLMLNKQTLVRKARLDIMYQTRLTTWLHLHVPLTIALLLALVIHILAIAFYW